MLLIKNGNIVDPVSGKSGKYDILIEDDIITRVEDKITDVSESDCEIYDAEGLTVSPGLTDVHVHFRDPGFTYKEDILSGAKAALAGGFTHVVLMANTKPVVDNEETLKYILDKSEQTPLKIDTCATVTKGLKGEELTDMETLKNAGAVGFTDDGIPIKDENVVLKAMEEAVRLNVPLSFHEEDPAYNKENGINHGKASEHFGIYGADRMAEISMIERDVKLAGKTGAKIDIQHISSKEGVDLVRQARKEHKNIFAEATPHHFSLNEEAVIEYGALAKMNPPLREEEDRLAIIEGLKDGTISIIATDHAPHSKEEKEGAEKITSAMSGITGLETALPLAITYLYKEGHLSLMEIIGKFTLGPAELYGYKATGIAPGEKADLCIYDPDESFVFEKSLSRSQNSPFIGKQLFGKIHLTVADGEAAYRS